MKVSLCSFKVTRPFLSAVPHPQATANLIKLLSISNAITNTILVFFHQHLYQLSPTKRRVGLRNQRRPSIMSHSSNSLSTASSASSTSSTSRTASTANSPISYPLPVYHSSTKSRIHHRGGHSAPNTLTGTKKAKHTDTYFHHRYNPIREPVTKEHFTSYRASPASSPTISEKSRRHSCSSSSTVFDKVTNAAYSTPHNHSKLDTATYHPTTAANNKAPSPNPHTQSKTPKPKPSRSCTSAFDFSYLNVYTTASGTNVNGGRRAVVGTPVSGMGVVGCIVM